MDYATLEEFLNNAFGTAISMRPQQLPRTLLFNAVLKCVNTFAWRRLQVTLTLQCQSQVLIATVEVGHIPGTLHRDLPRNDENHRDLSRRLDDMQSTFAMVRKAPAQDPAYRPT
jgi:hypothetical protein